jgi:hypothetical protein
MVQLNVESVEDTAVQDGFVKLEDLIRKNPFLNGEFKLYKATFTKGTTGKIKHGLRFKPMDIFITNISNGATASVDYTLTDGSFIALKFSAPCSVRVVAGFMTTKGEI